MTEDSGAVHLMRGLEGDWITRRTGAARALRRFPDRGEALAAAWKLAIEDELELVIHHDDGTVYYRHRPCRLPSRATQ